MIEFPPPAKLISMNDRTHWAVRARMTSAWRHAAFIAARQARLGALPPSTVTVGLPVRDSRRRDPHNYFATVKPIIDGLVDAGLWPDDNSDWVTVTEPVLMRAGDVLVNVKPREVQQ